MDLLNCFDPHWNMKEVACDHRSVSRRRLYRLSQTFVHDTLYVKSQRRSWMNTVQSFDAETEVVVNFKMTAARGGEIFSLLCQELLLDVDKVVGSCFMMTRSSFQPCVLY